TREKSFFSGLLGAVDSVLYQLGTQGQPSHQSETIKASLGTECVEELFKFVIDKHYDLSSNELEKERLAFTADVMKLFANTLPELEGSNLEKATALASSITGLMISHFNMFTIGNELESITRLEKFGRDVRGFLTYKLGEIIEP